MRKNLRAGIAAAAVALTVASGGAALAVTSTGSFSATCDPANYGHATDNRSYQHASQGTLSIRQTGSSPRVTSNVYATSQNGNSLTGRNIGDGETASWSNVRAGQYRVFARSSSTVNCNGILPGQGNYTFQYSITYR
jgi:hypothetical protein